MIKRILLGILTLGIVGTTIFFLTNESSAKKDDGPKTVAVSRGTIIDKALAVGRIEPRKEITVKSKISGLVKRIYVEVGDRVRVGDPLFDIAPDPTPLEYAEAKRQVEIAQVEYANQKREFDRTVSLRDKQLISHQEWESKNADCESAELRLKLATEKLALIETGRTSIAGRQIESVIRSTVNGTILAIEVEEGDPVVPLTSFQSGTGMMSIAFMEDLVFKGNVDEIDVGKLAIGQQAEIEIGAISNHRINGELVRVSPKAHKEEGSTLFEVEIAITDAGDKTLRAGYSANADIIVIRKDSILLVPERLLTITDSTRSVEVRDSAGVITPRAVETGLSDGINIEVLTGLAEGELVVERPPKEITAR